jgi:hypothetical protein
MGKQDAGLVPSLSSYDKCLVRLFSMNRIYEHRDVGRPLLATGKRKSLNSAPKILSENYTRPLLHCMGFVKYFLLGN